MKPHYTIKWLTEQFESGNTLNFIYFWGHSKKPGETVGKFCFSQWFESPFTVNTIVFKTSEHWMMANKALLFGDTNNFQKIINCENPGEAKEFGRQVLGYDDGIWNEKKFEIVKMGNIHKFNQHPDFAEYLLKTENSILVEASPVDPVWGIGLSQESEYIDNIYAWPGQNLLGFVFMETRDFLKDFGHFKHPDNALQPPWRQFENVDSRDMFWRMGKGEDYVMSFSKYYSALSDSERIIYELTNPAPYEWRRFYDK